MIKTLLFGGAGGGNFWADLGLLIGRVGIGALMAIGHGWFKLPPGKGFVGTVESLGFPAPTLFAWAAALAEFGGGLLLALGLLTRPAALLIVLTMGVAAFGAHANDPWLAAQARGGASKEMALLFLIPSLMFLLTGPGHLSIDAMIHSKASKPRSKPKD